MPLKSIEKRDYILNPSLVFCADLAKHDGASFMSDDQYGHLATVTGATWTLQGRDYDGVDDRVNCGTGASLNVTNLYLSMWFRLVNTNIAGRYLLAKADNILIYQVANTYNVKIELVVATGNAQVTITGLSADIWYHLAYTWDGATLSAYINGVLQGTDVTKSGNITVTATPLILGAYNAAGGYPLRCMEGLVSLRGSSVVSTVVAQDYQSEKHLLRI